jgi:hypothetical protein
MKENTETLLRASRVGGVGINAEKAGIANELFENEANSNT